MNIVAPSLLAADFSNLKEEVSLVESSGAQYLHLDVMDGHFVPNITFGPGLVASLRKHSRLTFDVHLMIEQPDRYLHAFHQAGADIITVHAETCPHLHRTIESIKQLGLKAGVALNPASPLTMVAHVLEYVDMVLLMTVNPGFGGQKFIAGVLPKISSLRQMLAEAQLPAAIQVDGGIDGETAAAAVKAGAEILVAGSYVFKTKQPARSIAHLLQA